MRGCLELLNKTGCALKFPVYPLRYYVVGLLIQCHGNRIYSDDESSKINNFITTFYTIPFKKLILK